MGTNISDYFAEPQKARSRHSDGCLTDTLCKALFCACLTRSAGK
jgi:hypothetical protein